MDVSVGRHHKCQQHEVDKTTSKTMLVIIILFLFVVDFGERLVKQLDELLFAGTVGVVGSERPAVLQIDVRRCYKF